MARVYLIGVATTAFRRWAERGYADLAGEVVRAVLADAGVPGAGVGFVAFGSCASQEWGQPNVRGQVILQPLVTAGTLPRHVPIANLEAGCATGILALQAARREVEAGADLALAVGVDKTMLADPLRIGLLFEGATDRLDPVATRAFYAQQAEAAGLSFAPTPSRSVLLDVAALSAKAHMARFGTTPRQLAAVASKNRGHAVHNANAQLRAPIAVDAVLAERLVIDPFTRSMCAPLGDGAAAALVCSEAFLARHPALRARAVALRGLGLAGGTLRALDEASETGVAAGRAWADAGVGPADVQVAEVHDATSFAELAALEALGFRSPGEAAAWSERGGTTHGGDLVVNPSGGLESRGHPLAASGLAMVHEIVTQLRGEAGPRQVPGARLGLVHNAGGQLGFDEALCGVAVLGG
jgi:acetyl-CoA acetyltransferase